MTPEDKHIEWIKETCGLLNDLEAQREKLYKRKKQLVEELLLLDNKIAVIKEVIKDVQEKKFNAEVSHDK